MGVYQNAIEYFKRVADSRYVAAGLTSNVDLLVRWDTGVIQKWVDQYATGPRNISNVENMTDLVICCCPGCQRGGRSASSARRSRGRSKAP